MFFISKVGSVRILSCANCGNSKVKERKAMDFPLLHLEVSIGRGGGGTWDSFLVSRRAT